MKFTCYASVPPFSFHLFNVGDVLTEKKKSKGTYYVPNIRDEKTSDSSFLYYFWIYSGHIIKRI